MSVKLKNLQEKRRTLAAGIRKHAETQDKWNAEDKATWDRLNVDYDAVLAEIKTENENIRTSADAIASKLAALDADEADPSEEGGGDGEGGGSSEPDPGMENMSGRRRTNMHGEGTPRINSRTRALAMQAWFRAAGPRRGEMTNEHRNAAKACGVDLSCNEFAINLSPDFHGVRTQLLPKRHGWRSNALTTQEGGSGGFTFGDTFVASLEEAMLFYGGMLEVAEVIRTTTGEPMRWPTTNDTGNTGRQIGENAAVSAATDPTFKQKVWNAYKFTSDEILVPFELLRDNAVNLATVLAKMLGERLGRIQNTKYTLGSGNSTPYGIVTLAAAGVTTASATAIAWDEVIDLEHSLDVSRRRMPGTGYMFHDNALKLLRKLKDGNGGPIWQSGWNAGAPDTINTYPYQVNNDMASSVAASAVTMLFGNFPQYKIRQVGDIRMYRLVERHRENDQDAFLAFIEGDGNLLDAGDGPVRKLTQHA